MDYGLIGAELINKRLVSVLYYGESSDINDVKFQLEVNGKTSRLEIARFNRSDKLFRLELGSEVDILLGNLNVIKTNDGESRPLSYDTYVISEEFKELYAERYKIEAKNSELKSNFGYDTANACGKTCITIQGASALFLANIKRIIKLKEAKLQNNG